MKEKIFAVRTLRVLGRTYQKDEMLPDNIPDEMLDRLEDADAIVYREIDPPPVKKRRTRKKATTTAKKRTSTRKSKVLSETVESPYETEDLQPEVILGKEASMPKKEIDSVESISDEGE